MAIDERSRHALFVRLEEILGPEQASTLMEHLPPVGWADVATKRDLDQLEARMHAGIMSDVYRELAALQRHMTMVLVSTVSGSMVTVAALAFAAAKLV